jgi:hypothetical protein
MYRSSVPTQFSPEDERSALGKLKIPLHPTQVLVKRLVNASQIQRVGKEGMLTRGVPHHVKRGQGSHWCILRYSTMLVKPIML